MPRNASTKNDNDKNNDPVHVKTSGLSLNKHIHPGRLKSFKVFLKEIEAQ